MGKKVKEQDVSVWISQGNIKKLQEHWSNPVVIAYREKQLNTASWNDAPFKNVWLCSSVLNGKTCVFLYQHDPVVAKTVKLESDSSWRMIFFNEGWQNTATLFRVLPPALKNKDAIDTLHTLAHPNLNDTLPIDLGTLNRVTPKIGEDLHEFYRIYKGQNALTALAWLSNNDYWHNPRTKPTMAQLIRHASLHHPQDVLGAYLVWSLRCSRDDGYASMPEHTQDHYENCLKQLITNATRCGVDMSDFEQQRKIFVELYKGLGIDINVQEVAKYTASYVHKSCAEFQVLDAEFEALFSE